MFEVLVGRADSDKTSLYMPPKLRLDRSRLVCLLKEELWERKWAKQGLLLNLARPGLDTAFRALDTWILWKEATVEEATRRKLLQGHALYLPILFFFFLTHLHCIFCLPRLCLFFFFHSFALFLISQFKPHSRIIIRYKKLNVLQIWRFSSVIDVCEKQMIWWW